jgi:predicted extracellular nuclease
MFRKDKFQYCATEYFQVYFEDRDYHSRPIMRVDLCELTTRDTLSIFINHWPSRRGGKQKSDPFRVYAAEILIDAMESTLKKHPEYSLLITGDFNDDRKDECLRMVEDLPWVDYLVKDLPKGVEGSYYYEGEWIHFDHFMVSNFKDSHFIIENAKIFAPYWIREKPSQGPLRFYKGIKTSGGYSDHYSILLNFGFKRKVVE